ncbi:hypothetical protein JAAARDRAFT_413893 [Jaapia argillacea MUCL 33604]|uniref:Uncharacterized protein n=1 Tax=Jaapia argillacea MUCL 33604 TaxID=933084 RepID=A0A067PK08_9AGAM|nr:hypothetical protein JAAARDRAFT_413893 [Jaapia argillacea MUCL 33604]
MIFVDKYLVCCRRDERGESDISECTDHGWHRSGLWSHDQTEVNPLRHLLHRLVIRGPFLDDGRANMIGRVFDSSKFDSLCVDECRDSFNVLQRPQELLLGSFPQVVGPRVLDDKLLAISPNLPVHGATASQRIACEHSRQDGIVSSGSFDYPFAADIFDGRVVANGFVVTEH